MSIIVPYPHWTNQSDADMSVMPPYLEKRSAGAAVVLVQTQLIQFGCTHGLRLTPGAYDEVMEMAVKRRQRQMGWRLPNDVDGRWGPATRKRHVQYGGVDLDAIPASSMPGATTRWFHHGVEYGGWPHGLLYTDGHPLI